MSGIGVRIARNVDIPVIEAVVAAAFGPFVAGSGIIPAPLSTDWATVISALGASVAVRDDRLVGVLVLWPHPGHVLIDTLAVAPDAQASGVGSALLEHSQRVALSRGVHVVRLYSNAGMTESLAWYVRRGFVETGRGVEDGFDRVHLETVLA